MLNVALASPSGTTFVGEPFHSRSNPSGTSSPGGTTSSSVPSAVERWARKTRSPQVA
jgi:hypothetical protein